MAGEGDTIPDHGNLETSFEKLSHVLHKDEWYLPILQKVERVTAVKREYLVIGVGIAVLFSLVFGFAGQIICHLVGFIYPGLLTVRVIESGETDAALNWLKYWIIYSFITVVEAYLLFILKWVPFYWLAKCMILVWCLLSSGSGLSIIYSALVFPFFKSMKNPSTWLHQAMEIPADSPKTTSMYSLRKRTTAK